MNNDLVSVIISTKNEESVIENLLRSIKNQTYKPIEIILVDNNSSDKTKNIVKRYTSLVFNKGPERSAQRNLGAGKASGKYVVFLDADMALDSSVIKECVGKIKNQKIGGVIIPERSIGKGFWSKVKAFERSFYVGEDSIEAARFFKKSVFLECGGYNENITGPEDWDMSQRVKSKYEIGRIKNFISHDEGEARFTDFIKKKYYYGKGAAMYLNNHSLKVTGQQVIYILRPAFYKKWTRMIKNPGLACGIMILLVSEQIAGFLGFLRGKFH